MVYSLSWPMGSLPSSFSAHAYHGGTAAIQQAAEQHGHVVAQG